MNIVDVIKSGDFVILDSETTGLLDNPLAEICQIAVIDSIGNTLLDTLCKTVHPIPQVVTAIHGIDDSMVKDAPLFPAVDLFTLLLGKNVIIYNASYDTEMLFRSTSINGYPHINWNENITYYCAMKAFAPIYGDYNSYRKSYRWKSLAAACSFYGIPVPEDAHSALADCRSTLAVVKAMAASEAVE
jgi:DNA polymerase III subunit epsilon